MYILLFVVVFIFAWIFLSKKFLKNGKKAFLIAAGFALFLYAALRSKDYSGDVIGYVNKFNNYKNYSFEAMLKLYTTDIKNPTFHLLGWLIGRIFGDAQFWIAFIGAVYAFSGVFVIYKESESPLMSVIAWISLGFFSFSLTGLRQAMALSFTMLAYFPAKNRKLLWFLLLTFIATLFHTSAFIFVLIYPIANKKMGLFHVVVAIVVVVVFIAFQGQLRSFISQFFEETYLSGYADSETKLTFAGLIVQLAIFAFGLIYYPNVVKKYEHANVLYNLAFIGVIFQVFSSMIAEFFRVSMYFSFFNILLIPLAIQSEPNKKTRQVLSLVIGIVLLLFAFRNGIPTYEFFWG